MAQGIKDAELIFVSVRLHTQHAPPYLDILTPDEYTARIEATLISQVNTPTKQYGLGKGFAADVMYIELCARSIAEHATSSKIVIEKSTVPARTAQTLDTILSHNSKEGISFQVKTLLNIVFL